MEVLFLFFFSSRRRHTRYWRDWSSDVCSSDLPFYFSQHYLLFLVPPCFPLVKEKLVLFLVAVKGSSLVNMLERFELDGYLLKFLLS